jgi:hypothetical protein
MMEQKESPRSVDQQDADLIDAVRRAARAGIPPADVEEYVGSTAWINTIREPDRLAVAMADIAADDESGTETPKLADARDVAYWGRPVESQNPRLVGITWDAEGTSRIFFGVLYPP